MHERESLHGRDGRMVYEPPAVEERASISAPLNTVAVSKAPPPSPRWARPESD